ncbi:MAG TPA: VWA domain-containing protein [Vicinamibacterales bacterium]|nr:VWA domain-containing protein [Vicinamibacterales bacterium]
MSSPTPVVLIASLMCAAGLQQAPFRTTTDIVPVYATVLDKDRLVTDLKQSDFTITDNGKVQEITFFSNEVAPFSGVVMLDRSGSMFSYQLAIREAASAFVRQLFPDDLVRIGSFGDNGGNRIVIRPSAFTDSKGELLEILNAPIGLGNTSPVFISIDQSITALLQRSGRRVVVIFSDGYDAPAKSLMAVKPKDLIDRARQADVLVYALGVVRVEDRGQGRAPRVTPPDPILEQLAKETGGSFFELRDSSDLTRLFTRVLEELHRQYTIGFVPQVRDGKVHTIQVKVNNKDLTVRARQSYFAR